MYIYRYNFQELIKLAKEVQKQLDRIKGGGESGEESDSEICSEPNPENREEFKEPTVEVCDPDTEPEGSEILGSQKTEEYFEEESESELSQESLDSEPVEVILGSHFLLPLSLLFIDVIYISNIVKFISHILKNIQEDLCQTIIQNGVFS